MPIGFRVSDRWRMFWAKVAFCSCMENLVVLSYDALKCDHSALLFYLDSDTALTFKPKEKRGNSGVKKKKIISKHIFELS